MIIVDDETITQEEAIVFRDEVLHPLGKGPTWAFTPVTNYVQDAGTAVLDNNTLETHQMVAPIGPNHPLRPKIIKMLTKLANQHGIKVRSIERIKFNMLTTMSSEHVGKYHMPHVDLNLDHNVLLYYVNDSDGDTFMFEETFTDGGKAPETYTTKERISPKMGRSVIFSGSQYHASSSPILSDYRCILNVDFI